MRWKPPDPMWPEDAKKAYRNMILATRRAAVENNVSVGQMMQAVAETALREQKKKSKIDGANES